MYKIYNNLAPTYLHGMFQMRDVNLGNTASILRSVAHKYYLLPQAKCNPFKGSCLPRVPFVNCRQFMYLVISLLVLRAGYGI